MSNPAVSVRSEERTAVARPVNACPECGAGTSGINRCLTVRRDCACRVQDHKAAVERVECAGSGR